MKKNRVRKSRDTAPLTQIHERLPASKVGSQKISQNFLENKNIVCPLLWEKNEHVCNTNTLHFLREEKVISRGIKTEEVVRKS